MNMESETTLLLVSLLVVAATGQAMMPSGVTWQQMESCYRENGIDIKLLNICSPPGNQSFDECGGPPPCPSDFGKQND